MEAKILYLEDNQGQARLLQRRLGRAGYDVDLAASGQEGIERCRTGAYELLVVDHQLPDINGLEVIRSLDAEKKLPPVIMLTGAGNEQVAVEVMKLGASDYILKDSDTGYLELLPSVIERALKQKRLLEEKQAAEASLREYAAELKARNEELDAFAQMVAHDLRAPLTLLIGVADVLLTYLDDLERDEIREHLTAILRDGRRMDNIIDELLVLASVRNLKPELKPLSMADILQEVMQRLRFLIKNYRAEIVMPADVAWPVTIGHAPWIESVWVNYISNAIKYGGEVPRVELGADPEPDGMIRFWVRDNGNGLSEEEQVQLFRAFTRLSDVRVKGEGIGLSIVHRIVSKLGGQVGVESRPGQGSIFYFTLPQASDSQV